MDMFTEIGVGGILAVMILKEVLPFVTNGGQSKGEIAKMRHREIRESLGRIHTSIEKQTSLYQENKH